MGGGCSDFADACGTVSTYCGYPLDIDALCPYTCNLCDDSGIIKFQ